MEKNLWRFGGAGHNRPTDYHQYRYRLMVGPLGINISIRKISALSIFICITLLFLKIFQLFLLVIYKICSLNFEFLTYNSIFNKMV